MKKKRYWKMTATELAEATNSSISRLPWTSLVPRLRPSASRGRGSNGKGPAPGDGQGFQRVSLSIERGLLKGAGLAKKRRLSRSQLFAQMLEASVGRGVNARAEFA